MARHGAVTFKGTPLTLVGNAVAVGQAAPAFTLRYYEAGEMKTISPADLKGKPAFISVVPSLDTPVCQLQTKKFNEHLAAMGDKIHALTVSLDLPFAMNRFCGAEQITNMRAASDYYDRSFGENWGMLIDELKLLARGAFVVDKNGKVVYAEQVKEVANEPNYDAALNALKPLLA
jgi:thioredoxin-dependent peroxiredoxin